MIAIEGLIVEMRRTLRNSAPIGSGETRLNTSATGSQVAEWARLLEITLQIGKSTDEEKR